MKRINWLDTAKGLGIIFIILGHTSIPPTLKGYLFSFHVPLFFFISGIFFSSKSSFSDFMKNKSQRLLIPYFFFAICSYLVWCLANADNNVNLLIPLFGTMYGIATKPYLVHNTALWFLLCLFNAYLIFYFISKLRTKIKIAVSLLISLIVGYLIVFLPFRAPWSLGIAFVAVVFLGAGFLFRDYLKEKFGKENNKFLIILVVFIISIYLGHFNADMSFDMSARLYGNNILYSLAAAFSGTIFWLYISYLIPENKILNYIGNNSLILMATHSVCISVLVALSKRILHFPISVNYVELQNINSSANPFAIAVILTILSIIFSIPVIELINKKFPYLIGSKGQ